MRSAEYCSVLYQSRHYQRMVVSTCWTVTVICRTVAGRGALPDHAVSQVLPLPVWGSLPYRHFHVWQSMAFTINAHLSSNASTQCLDRCAGGENIAQIAPVSMHLWKSADEQGRR